MSDDTEPQTAAEAYDEARSDPERPSVEHEDEPGAKIGAAIGGALGRFVLNISLMLSRLMPGSTRMWRSLLKASYKGLYKSSSSVDCIGHIMVGGEIKHVPLTYDYEQERYKTLSDDPEWWETPSEAESEYRVGPVPSVWASSTENELGSHVQAEVAEALEVGQEEFVCTDATVQHVTVEQTGPIEDGAVADGGQAVQQRQEMISVEDVGKERDWLAVLDWDDADARVVSMDKYGDTYPETAASEKMDRERQLGRLMEKDRDLSKYAMKMLLIAGAIVIGALAVVFIGPSLLGSGGVVSGGGGGGGALPFSLAPPLGLM